MECVKLEGHMRGILQKSERKIQFIYEVVYILLIISTFNSFLYTSSIQSLLVKICLATAACAIVLRLCFIRNYLNTPYWILLFLFMISYLLSTVINYHYGYVNNLKWLIWMGLSFFLLYLRDYKCDAEYYKKEFVILGHLLLLYSVIASVVSLYLMVTRYAEYLQGANGIVAMAGYFWGRLWGVYTDPNYGAVFCVLMMICGLYFAHENKNKFVKILYYIAILLDFLYVIYSDSRTAKLTIFVGGAFYIFANVWYLCRKKENRKRIVIALGAAVIFVVAMNGIMSSCKSIYINKIAVAIEKNEAEAKKTTSTSKKLNKNKSVTSTSAAKEREKDVKKDISNRRFDLWKSGLEVWATTPLFGTGYETYDEYAMANLPKTYTVNNDQGIFENTHNQYINILVFQGIVGAAIFLVFMLLMVWKVIPFIWTQEGKDFFYTLTMATIVVVIAIAMVFLLEGLYTNSFGSFLLWYVLGNEVHFIEMKRSQVVI